LKKHLITVFLAAFFFVIGIIILLDQYLNIEIWFELKDLHHETFALSSFALAIGIILGSNLPKNRN